MAASKTVTVGSAPSVTDMIPQAEANQEYGDSSTVSVSDILGGNGGTVEIDLTPPKQETTVTEEDKPDATTVPDEDEDAEEEEPDVDESLAIAQALVEQFGTDPAAAMKALWDAAGGEAQSKFIKTIAGESQSAAESEFEPENDFETGLMPVFKDLKDIPQFKESVKGAFSQHADFINDAHLQVNVLSAMVQALGEASGVKFPEPDLDGMLKAVKGGKSYADATKAFKQQLTKAVTKVKQADKDRPANSRNEAGGRIIVDPKADLATMIRNYKEGSQG